MQQKKLPLTGLEPFDPRSILAIMPILPILYICENPDSQLYCVSKFSYLLSHVETVVFSLGMFIQ